MGQEKPERAGRGRNSVGIQLQLPGHFHPVAAAGIPPGSYRTGLARPTGTGNILFPGNSQPLDGNQGFGIKDPAGIWPFPAFPNVLSKHSMDYFSCGLMELVTLE